ncbi:MAG: methyltransferase domain-containing protein [archaeon]
MRALDLGCWKNKKPGAFGVDFHKYSGVDLKWDLEKPLPKKYWNSFDEVYSAGLLEHLGNPQFFLENCRKYLKKGGKLEIITDNADYWRFHFVHRPVIGFFGAYHATLWNKEDKSLQTQHKMLFQAGHLETLLNLAGFKKIKADFYYQKNLDVLLPRKFGSMYLTATAEK